MKPGIIYFPPDGFHIKVDKLKIQLDPNKGNYRHKPSIDCLFNSIFENYGSKSIAVLLTGMGSDGAEGLEKIRKAGGYTIAQDEATSIVYGMPRVAKENGSVKEVLPIEKIASRLLIMGGAS